jgi:hypothetical protein
MDRITKALLDEFIEQNSLQHLEEEKAFERFAGYLVTSGHYTESFHPDEISVGAGGDCGIDCIGIIVNGSLVTEPDEIEEFASVNGYLDVTFVFTQASRSPEFSTAKIGQFAFGVCDFFSDKPSLSRNSAVQSRADIWVAILKQSRLFKKGNPQCFLYYATTGKWTGDPALAARLTAAIRDVEELGLFRRVTFDCVDAERLQQLYRASQNAINTEIMFAQKTVIPEISGVQQAYLGLLPATEFLKLVENQNQEMLATLFYDNVRHWQEWNPVNNEIKDTLTNDQLRVLFPLLNNGVTIVARRISPTGDKFLVEDYQVVNGCQTSFVLHECRASLNEKTMVPVRLIATNNDAIKNAIIKATNRQTQVTDEQLFALSDFPKKLETYFSTFSGKSKLYYERRSRQYSGQSSIEKVRVINMTMLIRAFASMFLMQPHRTTKNYKALLALIGKDIFNKDHSLFPYYVSAYAHYRLEYLFRSQTLESELKPARYHLLMAYRLFISPLDPPRTNSHEIDKYCDPIYDSLLDDERNRETFLRAAERVRVVAGRNLQRDNIRTEPFTNALMADLRRVKVERQS